MARKKITSVRMLIEQLGGPKAAGEFFSTTPQNVVNWRLAGKIPARFHFVHKRMLRERGYRIADTCWGFVEAVE